jgi:predicted N-acetyltransferase YhbS
VAIDSTRTVLGFYSLVSDRLEHQDAPPDLTRGMGQRPIPMTLLACLAIDEHEQRGGLGTALVLHAFNTALDAAELVGSRGILVHPINEELYRYYARFGFRRLNSVPSAEETSMYVLMKDLRATFEAFGHGEDNP